MNSMKLMKSVVKLPKTGGRGVLVGEVVLTAAHCLEFTANPQHYLASQGAYFIEEIESYDGRRFKVQPLAVELVSDIAVLGSLDCQEFYDESNAFDSFCESTPHMRMATLEIKLFEKFPVRALDRDVQWLDANAEICCDLGSIAVETERQLQGGASGGPIVNLRGELVALISHSSNGPKSTGSHAIPRMALPNWVCKKFLPLTIPPQVRPSRK